MDLWERFTHGLRVALTSVVDDETPGAHKNTVLTVLDFGWHPRYPEHLEHDTTKYAEHGAVPTVIQNGGTFQNSVITGLPFASYTRVVEGQYLGFLMDEQRIVAVKVGCYGQFS